MAQLCPTVLAATPEDFHDQMKVVSEFADRIQIDLGDGHFTTRSIGLNDVTWPDTLSADIHLMYQNPMSVLPELIALQPALVIVHAESDGDLLDLADHLKSHTIQFGVALLQETTVESVRDLIMKADHVLLFSGKLGSFGGRADLSLLGKVPQIRALRPGIEIGWDGGINGDNITRLVDGGIDVLNVGGAIQKALHPENAYRDLLRRVNH